MIKRVFSLLNKNISGLHQTAYILGFFALLSQVLALLRDRLLAHSFGAGEILDIYYAAFRIPDFIFITVASIVSISVLVPLLTDEINKKQGRNFMSEVFSVFLCIVIVICSITFFLIPKLTPIILKGFTPEAIDQVVGLSRVLLLSPVLLGLSNFFTSIIQVNRKFFVYALSPLLYNIGIIIGILLFYPWWGLKGLALGVILGAFFHLAIQLPSIYRLKFIPKFVWVRNFRKIKKIIMLSLPRTLALSAGNLALIVLIGLASTMGEGSVSVFVFAFSLQSVPLSIVGISYSVAAFPALAKLFSNNQLDDFFEQITAAARHILFWTTIALVLLVVLRAQIVRTILGSGKFDWADTRLTAACLAAFSLSVAAQSLVLLFIRGYYAAGKTIKPVLISIFSAVMIIVSAFLLRWLFINVDSLKDMTGGIFRINDIKNIDVLILPISYSIGSLINVILLWIFFQRDFGRLSLVVGKPFLQTLFASVIMGVFAYFSLNLFNSVFDINTFWGIFLQGLLSGIVGLMALVLTLELFGNHEMKEILLTLKRKFNLNK
ncbi:MAG: lipid II flippase MurJ [Patescibacteria group bacterium]|nr:lipid II flippase MurJ [Patescibacteria group bacterium]